jgi:hypothetical protein
MECWILFFQELRKVSGDMTVVAIVIILLLLG